MTDLTTADLLREAEDIQGEDVRQEYLALRLEGHSPHEARRRSGPADPMASRNPQRGPLVRDQRPLVTDFRESEGLTSSTLDHRTDAEREAEWEAADVAASIVAQILDSVTPLQREALVLRFGLDGHEPRTNAEAAAAAETTVDRMRNRVDSARVALRRTA